MNFKDGWEVGMKRNIIPGMMTAWIEYELVNLQGKQKEVRDEWWGNEHADIKRVGEEKAILFDIYRKVSNITWVKWN